MELSIFYVTKRSTSVLIQPIHVLLIFKLRSYKTKSDCSIVMEINNQQNYSRIKKQTNKRENQVGKHMRKYFLQDVYNVISKQKQQTYTTQIL